MSNKVLETCTLCELIRHPESICGEVIERGNYNTVIHHQPPVSISGWLMIVPHRHITTPSQLTPDEYREIASLQIRYTKILEQVTDSERIYWVLFAEKVPHIHFHLIPRRKDHPLNFYGPSIFSYEEKIDTEEIEYICHKIRMGSCE